MTATTTTAADAIAFSSPPAPGNCPSAQGHRACLLDCSSNDVQHHYYSHCKHFIRFVAILPLGAPCWCCALCRYCAKCAQEIAEEPTKTIPPMDLKLGSVGDAWQKTVRIGKYAPPRTEVEDAGRSVDKALLESGMRRPIQTRPEHDRLLGKYHALGFRG